MTDTKAAATVLKILSGVQTGAEVSLTSGDYVLGSGPNDDIQIVDVSLKPGHVKLRLSPGKIEVSGGAGPLTSANGVALESGSDFHEVEPLDIITAGTTRFALGAVTAQWASIADMERPAQQAGPKPKRAPAAVVAADSEWWRRGRQIAIFLVLVFGFLLWQFSLARVDQNGLRVQGLSDLQILQNAVAQYPFAKAVDVRQEVDGTIFVNGYVEEPVERRAIANSVEKLGIPVRMRIWVLQILRSELDNLIKAENVNATSTISARGELTLDGVILNPGAAEKFVTLVTDRMMGISKIESRIKTIKLLIAEVEKLSQLSQIQAYVLFRDAGGLIEVTGAIPIEKIDAWIGFLQSYAKRFAKDVGLRSFVALQGADGKIIPQDRAIMIGGPGGANSLDIERLKDGQYGPRELFTNGDQAVVAAAGAIPGAENQTTQTTPTPPQPNNPSPGPAPNSADSPDGDRDAAPRPVSDGELLQRTKEILERWGLSEAARDDDPVSSALTRFLVKDSKANRWEIVERYLPALDTRPTTTSPCWVESQLSKKDVLSALFWLDLLSVSEKLVLSKLDKDMQPLLLEAALNPKRAAKCANEANPANPIPSIYLTEIGRNPDFARFITRDLAPFTLDITGASLASTRFVQIRNGRKLREGAAPDNASRIATVGELGIVIQLREKMSTVLFGRDINWYVE